MVPADLEAAPRIASAHPSARPDRRETARRIRFPTRRTPRSPLCSTPWSARTRRATAGYAPGHPRPPRIVPISGPRQRSRLSCSFGLPARPVLAVLAGAEMLDDDRADTIETSVRPPGPGPAEPMRNELPIWFEILRCAVRPRLAAGHTTAVTIRTRVNWSLPTLKAWQDTARCVRSPTRTSSLPSRKREPASGSSSPAVDLCHPQRAQGDLRPPLASTSEPSNDVSLCPPTLWSSRQPSTRPNPSRRLPHHDPSSRVAPRSNCRDLQAHRRAKRSSPSRGSQRSLRNACNLASHRSQRHQR